MRDRRRGWALGAAVAVSVAVLPALAPTPAAAGTLTVTLDVRTPSVFAGETVRTRLSVAGASATCSLQAARGTSAQWSTLRTVTLRAGRGIDISVATTGWRLGSWRLRALCPTARSVQSLTIAAPPPWSAASVTIPDLVPVFDPDITDYVVREPESATTCDLEITASAPDGIRIGLDGRAPVTGTSATTVSLSPGQGTLIRIRRGGVERVASVRCLPNDFPTITATGQGTAPWYASDLAFGADQTAYAYVIDSRGTPVWWMRDADGRPTSVRYWTADELSALGMRQPYAMSWMSRADTKFTSLDGTIVDTGWNTDRHDLQPSGTGTVYAIRYVNRTCGRVPSECADMTAYGGSATATITDCQIIELDTDGNVLWQWNSRDHIPLAWTGHWLTDRFTGALNTDGTWDIIHANAVQADGDAVILSMRNADAIIKIDKATGDILWKLGGTSSSQSLTVVDDLGAPVTGRVLSGQHDVRLLADGTITAYDNGTLTPRKGRAVRFAIDEAAGTATLLESVSDPQQTRGSACCGSARRLNNGNWIVAWGANPLVSEVTPAGSAVFSLTFTGTRFPYRIVPIVDDALPPDAWRDGMDAMHPRS